VNVISSNGFIRYTIKPKIGLPIGTAIKNRAAIIFDFNEPIITNTVNNTLVEPSSAYEPAVADDDDILVFPNPTENNIFVATKNAMVKNIVVMDISGKLLRESNEASVDMSFLPKGIYIITINLENGARVNKRVTLQ
jgi:hypothetical protein